MVTMTHYEMTRLAFIKAHKGIRKEYTSHFEGCRWHKEIECEDGAMWYEVNQRITKTVKANTEFGAFPVELDLLRVEYWSSDNPTSKYAYEKY